MARKPALHTADDLLSPALGRTVAALDAPESDQALIALTMVLAASIDRMSNEERARMLGQTAPAYLRCLAELEQRSQRRAEPPQRPGGTWLDQQRESYARRHAPAVGRA
jgi:hypothetical protein